MPILDPWNIVLYSKILILRPALVLSKSCCPKVVLKTTFGQSQRWSLIRGILGVENEEKNCLNFANKIFNRKYVLILGGLNSGISLYYTCLRYSYFCSKTYVVCFRIQLKKMNGLKLDKSEKLTITVGYKSQIHKLGIKIVGLYMKEREPRKEGGIWHFWNY